MMTLAFRWYGAEDRVTLDHIRQIPRTREVVFALHGVSPGQAWAERDVRAVADRIAEKGLLPGVVESIPVAESIKLGSPERDRDIEAWTASLRAVASVMLPYREALGHPPVITYNFMPAFDWLRTDLNHTFSDGSTSLAYREDKVATMDPASDAFALPGWFYDKRESAKILAQYREKSEADIYANLRYFLEAALPEAERAGLVLAIHPDDPPWSVFGIPRIITGETALDRLFSDLPSPSNGLCFCTGSLGCTRDNDIYAIAEKFAARIQFAHLRNVVWLGERSFAETAHASPEGSLDLARVVRILSRQKRVFPVRPDHGRMIWGEDGKHGYGLYDRALGAMYLAGLIEMSEKMSNNYD